jgi:NADH-quinone oxidoreductase subunit M
MDSTVQLWIFLALFAGFAIKVPLFPLHTWLPLAHTQAPTAGSVLLAGILLKIGTYGFLRFSIPLLPDATAVCLPWLLWLSVIGIVYGALLALAQSNIKKLIAYSSVSHLGFCMLGIFALNKPGLYGGVLQSINHGLSTGGLFAIVGMIYDRYHTREIADLGGLAKRLPLLTTCMVLFALSSIGLPGTNGFAGEFLVLLGMFQRGYAEAPQVYSAQWLAIAIAAVSGVVLGAWYMLWLIERVFFRKLREPAHHEHDAPIRDMSLREGLALAPLLVFVFWIGLAPGHFLQPMSRDLDQILNVTAEPMAKLYSPSVVRPVAKRAEGASPRVVTESSAGRIRGLMPPARQFKDSLGGGLTRVD